MKGTDAHRRRRTQRHAPHQQTSIPPSSGDDQRHPEDDDKDHRLGGYAGVGGGQEEIDHVLSQPAFGLTSLETVGSATLLGTPPPPRRLKRA